MHKVTGKVEKSISINAPATRVWEYLTSPDLMKRWMGDPEMEVEVTTDWVVGNPIQTKGVHHMRFVNSGIVLRYEPQQIIQYSHLSSISYLPDTTANHSIVTFRLRSTADETLLKVQVENFPTESIYKHFDFYWQGTMGILKRLIEQAD